jgi:fumarate hydratase class I
MFEFQPLLPHVEHHDTPYRLLTKEGVSTFEAAGRRVLQVDSSAPTRGG